jgi:predicted amidohydrolase
MRIGFYQFSPEFGAIEKNLNKMATTLRSAEVDLVVFPELANSGYLFLNAAEAERFAESIPGQTTEFLTKLAAERDCHIVMGMPEKSGPKLYNSAVLIGPKGVVGSYRKAHLFDEEKLHFQPGDRGFSIFEIDGVNVGILICFDHLFPESARTLAIQGAQILCYPSNLVLPTYGQLTTRVRAIENHVYTILANRCGTEDRGSKKLSYTGGSQIVAPDGQVLATAPEDREQLSVVEIDPGKACDKGVSLRNDLFADRRPDLYKL